MSGYCKECGNQHCICDDTPKIALKSVIVKCPRCSRSIAGTIKHIDGDSGVYHAYCPICEYHITESEFEEVEAFKK
jgi:hypothetical protein